MPRFAANLNFLYPELPLWDRFVAAAEDGFEAVEMLFPYGHDAKALSAHLVRHGLELLFFNATRRGHPDERGIACLPGSEAAFRERFLDAVAYARALRCPFLHVMSGLVPPGGNRAQLRDTYVRNLRWAAAQARDEGIGILIEPINARDVPGFFLHRQDEAHAIVRDVGEPNVQVMMDLYHCAMEEGDPMALLKRHLPTGRVGHLQIAGVPGRHEPERGGATAGLDWPTVFRCIDDLGFDGWVGAEYHPRGATRAGLQWLRWANAHQAPGPKPAK
jgi:hydroxypyruvate isomerase